MAEQTVYCEECVEDIPADEVYWDEGQLCCKRCGSEMELPDRDLFEQIKDNRTGFLFRNAEPDDTDDEDDAEEEKKDKDDDVGEGPVADGEEPDETGT